MDILRFVNSKDIREHLRNIGYEFNSLEAAWLIYQCHDATIDEKHKAWNELIEKMPDCTVTERLNTVPQDSLHAFLRQYMELEDAELIIDRAWGWEPTTIADIKAYKPSSNSLSVGQVLKCPYNYEKTKLIVREMIDQHVLDLVDKGFVTDQIVLDIGYDIENLTDPKISARYHGDITTDRYGRKVPKHAHGTANLEKKTSSSHIITEATMNLFDRIINKDLLVRRITVATCKLVSESDVKNETVAEQISLFDDPVEKEKREQAEKQALEQEKQMQKTIIGIKKRFGKNAILKGMNFQEGATARERNVQVGGHKA